jgi:hypothetical protein
MYLYAGQFELVYEFRYNRLVIELFFIKRKFPGRNASGSLAPLHLHTIRNQHTPSGPKGPAKSTAGPAGSEGCIRMQSGEKGPLAPYGTQAPAAQRKGPKHHCAVESAQQRLVPLASLRSARVPAGFRPSF